MSTPETPHPSKRHSTKPLENARQGSPWLAVLALVIAGSITAGIIIAVNFFKQEAVPTALNSTATSPTSTMSTPTQPAVQFIDPGPETVQPAPNAASCDLNGVESTTTDADGNPVSNVLLANSPWLVTVVGCTPDYAAAIPSDAYTLATGTEGGSGLYLMFEQVDGQWTQITDPTRDILRYTTSADPDMRGFAEIMDERFTQAGFPVGLRAELLPDDPEAEKQNNLQLRFSEITSLDGSFRGSAPADWRYRPADNNPAGELVNDFGEFRVSVGSSASVPTCKAEDARTYSTIYSMPVQVGENLPRGEYNARVVVRAFAEAPYYAAIALVPFDPTAPDAGTSCAVDMGMELDGVSYFAGTSPYLPATGDLTGAPGRVLEFDSLESIQSFIASDEWLGWATAIRSQMPTEPSQ